MPHALTCPNGHEWTADSDDIPCPVCGSRGGSSNGTASTRASGTVDEFPPLPATQCSPAVRFVPGVWPEIPGYEIQSELGRGGMGVVYRCRHLALNRQVALKVIRSGNFAGKDEVARFRAEAEAVARLQHPNIIQIFDVGEHAGLPYLALEFADGGSLAEHLGGTTLLPRTAAELVATLARAVQHAHSRGVVHRDLKPANILLQGVRGEGSGARSEQKLSSLTPDPSPLTPLALKVTDFGLAKLLDEPGASRSGQVMGTPSYMAPEQAAGRGELVGPAADVWALGAILYEMLTRRPPFLGSSSIETMQQVLTHEPAPPTRHTPGVPRDLETICLKCLRKEVDGRYRTAGDLADDLDRFLEGRPVLARRTPVWERAVKWVRRQPAAAALVVAVACAGAAFAWLGYRHFRNLEDYNRDLEAKNVTITQNNAELENRNATITQQARALAAEKGATTRERDRAETNLLAALDVIDKMLAEMGFRKLAHVPHIDRARAVILEDAVTFCDRLAASQAEDPRLRLYLAFTLQRSGTILIHLNRYPEAQDRFDRALKLLAEIGPNEPPQLEPGSVRNMEALLRMERGRLFLHTNDLKHAREDFAAAQAIADRGGPEVRDKELDYLRALVNANLAIVALEEGDHPQAKLHLGRALQCTEPLVQQRKADMAHVSVHAFVLNTLGVVLSETDEPDRALELFDRSADLYRQLVAANRSNISYRQDLARSLVNYGSALRVKGYLKRAARPLAEALAICEELARDHPDVGEYVVDVARGYYQTGQWHRAQPDAKTAGEWYTKAVERLTKDSALVKGNTRARRLLADVYRARAAVRAELEQYRSAVEDLDGASKFVSLQLRSVVGLEKAGLLVSLGDIEKAIGIVDQILAAPDLEAEQRFAAARVFARAAKGTANAERAEALARRAIAELIAAEKSGYFRDPKRALLLTAHPDLTNLRTRDDFKRLQAAVGQR